MARIEGYQEVLPIKAGDQVTIKKGTLVTTVKKGSQVAGKTYKVFVHHTLPGTNYPVGHPNHDKNSPVTNATVVWPGPGGYWSSVDINEVYRGT